MPSGASRDSALSAATQMAMPFSPIQTHKLLTTDPSMHAGTRGERPHPEASTYTYLHARKIPG